MVLMIFAHTFHDFVHAKEDGGSQEGVVKDPCFIAELRDHLIDAFGMVGISDSWIDTTARDIREMFRSKAQ